MWKIILTGLNSRVRTKLTGVSWRGSVWKKIRVSTEKKVRTRWQWASQHITEISPLQWAFMLIYAQVLPAAQRRTRRQWWHKQLRVPVFSWTGQVLYKSATKFKKKWMEEGAQGHPHPQPNCGRIINFLSPQVSLNGICSITANVCRNLEVITDTALSLLGWIPWNPHCWWKMNSVTNIPLLWNDQKKRFFRDRKQVSGCRRLAVKVGIKCKQAKGTFRGVMGNVLELDCSRGPTPLWIY